MGEIDSNFYKGRKPKICILDFISNPYKKACLERIGITFHLKMMHRYNWPIWSQLLQPHKMLTVRCYPTTVHSNILVESTHKVTPLLEWERASPRSFLYTTLLLALVLHFSPDLVVDVCVQGRGGFKRIQWNQNDVVLPKMHCRCHDNPL